MTADRHTDPAPPQPARPIAPYWEDPDAGIALYHGDMREVLPALGLQADLIVADPPYGETSLTWDRWPDGWVETAAANTQSMWCFGSMRMFGEHWAEFRAVGWQLSQDVIGTDPDQQPVYGDVHTVWEKHNGSGFQNDRFKRVHEHALLWYRGDWSDQYRQVQTTPDAVARSVRTKRKSAHFGEIGRAQYVSHDGGPRLMRSVLQVRSMHGKAINETEKPLGVIEPIIRYKCPPGGLVIDPFAGSGSTLDAARQIGCLAIGIELRESQCEAAARRLSQLTLEAS